MEPAEKIFSNLADRVHPETVSYPLKSHDGANTISMGLCNRLYDLLLIKDQKVVRECWHDCCSIRSCGKVFAWIKHSSHEYGLQVWFLGDFKEAKLYAVPVKEYVPGKRKVIRWRGFGGYFIARSESELMEVVNFLMSISHPQSRLRKSV